VEVIWCTGGNYLPQAKAERIKGRLHGAEAAIVEVIWCTGGNYLPQAKAKRI